jgi:hypothetical protein
MPKSSPTIISTLIEACQDLRLGRKELEAIRNERFEDLTPDAAAAILNLLSKSMATLVLKNVDHSAVVNRLREKGLGSATTESSGLTPEAPVASASEARFRLELNVTAADRHELHTLAREIGTRSLKEVIRLALSVLKVILAERRAGRKIIVTTAEGKPMKELVFPSLGVGEQWNEKPR